MDKLKKATAPRNIGADVVRCFAFFCVVAVHCLAKSGYYSNTFIGEKMLILTIFKSLFMICVPLYMMLSGYLSRNKKPEIRYYKKAGSIYLTYVLAGLFCILFTIVYLGYEWDAEKIIFSMLDFTAAPYAWYIEMYLGLFLLIPFLNILYNNIPTKNQKKILIVSMIVLTALPAVLNVYDLNEFDFYWINEPATMEVYTKIFPDWWTGIYPLTYYFIGCYLSEYGLKIKKIPNILLIIVTVCAAGFYTYWRSYKSVYIHGDWGEYEAVFYVLIATLVFAFLINLKYDKVPRPIAKVLKTVSGLSLGAYLVSWAVDTYFYMELAERVPVFSDRIVYFVPLCIIVAICDLVIAYIVSKIQILLELIFSLIWKAVKWIIGLFAKIIAKK